MAFRGAECLTYKVKEKAWNHGYTIKGCSEQKDLLCQAKKGYLLNWISKFRESEKSRNFANLSFK